MQWPYSGFVLVLRHEYFLSAILTTTNPKQTATGLNPGLYNMEQASHRLKYDTLRDSERNMAKYSFGFHWSITADASGQNKLSYLYS